MGAGTARLLVVTGGLGRVGTLLRPHLARHYRLRLVDLPAVAAREKGVVAADLADPTDAERAVAGADAVIHLAAAPSPRITWDEAHAANIVPTRVLLEAAAAAGVPRLVLASSVHAMGEYNRPKHRPVDPSWAPRPCCPYGLSKVIIETLGRLHAERTGATVICLRLGLTGWPVTERRYLGMWLSEDDAARLFLAALSAPGRFGVHFGVSANTRRHWDTTSAVDELGYRPRDDSESLAEAAGPPAERLCRLFGEDENTPGRRT